MVSALIRAIDHSMFPDTVSARDSFFDGKEAWI